MLAGIFLFLWLLCSLVKANQFVRKLASQPRSSSSGSSSSSAELVAGVLYIATNAAVVGWLTSGQRLYLRFLLQPPDAPLSVGLGSAVDSGCAVGLGFTVALQVACWLYYSSVSCCSAMQAEAC
jgi:hypothetical protein